MRWQVHLLKCVIFGMLPFGSALRRIKRRFVPYPIIVQEWKVKEFFRHLALLKEAGFSPRGRSILEIGPGWHPVFALLYYLAGAERITLVDSQRLMDARLLTGTSTELFTKYGETIAAELGMGMDELRSRLLPPEASTFVEKLAFYRIEYLAPADVCNDLRKGQRFDLITSIDVMEHIPPEMVKNILNECYEIMEENGRMMHLIDHCDHWSFVDSKLSSVHFLKYGDRAMGLLYRLNPLEYQNRLRHDDYIQLFSDAGFSIINAVTKVDEKAIKELSTMKLNAKYMGKEHRQLAITTSLLIAGKRDTSMVRSCS